MSGSPGIGLKSNMAGRLEVWATATLDVWVGKMNVGVGPLFGSGTVSRLGGSGCSGYALVVVSRGSMKTSSGAAPLLVTVTGTVIGVPEASVVDALSGSPATDTCTLLNAMVPEYAWDSSLPSTGSAKSTISVQVPAAGSSVYAVADRLDVPLSEFCPKPRLSPSGLTRYSPTGSLASLVRLTLAVMSVVPDGTLNW